MSHPLGAHVQPQIRPCFLSRRQHYLFNFLCNLIFLPMRCLPENGCVCPKTVQVQYRIQGCHEPRLNCLLHPKSTVSPALDDTKSGSPYQPGYRYGSVTMKARSHDNLPHTHLFTKKVEVMHNDSTERSERNAGR